MRVLLTGGTSRQIKPPEERSGRGVQKIDVPDYVRRVLEDLGCEVDWRKIEPGEPLGDYDLIWWCVANWLSVNSVEGTPGALWAYHESLVRHVPLVAFYDDWSAAHRPWSNCRTIQRDPRRYLLKYLKTGQFFWKKDSPEVVERYLNELAGAASRMVEGTWPDWMATVCPMYSSWGDKTVAASYVWTPRWTFIDPSPCVQHEIVFPSPGPTTKLNEWVMGSLSDQEDWIEKQGFSWRVETFGRRDNRLDGERDVLHAYNDRWGVLSAPYSRLVGAGWFRSRYLYAASVGSIVYGDKRDVPRWFSVDEVESSTPAERTDMAREQANAFFDGLWSYEDFRAKIGDIVGRMAR